MKTLSVINMALAVVGVVCGLLTHNYSAAMWAGIAFINGLNLHQTRAYYEG